MTEPDERFDPHIDAAVRQMVAGEPAPGFVRLVMARVEASARRTGPAFPWRAGAAAAAVSLVVLLSRWPDSPIVPSEPAVAPDPDVPAGPPATSGPAEFVTAPRLASAAGPEPAALVTLDPIVIVPIGIEPIALADTAVARVEVAPLTIDDLEIPSLEDRQ